MKENTVSKLYSDAQQTLAALCEQESIPLDQALFCIAQDEDPTVDDAVFKELDRMASQVHLPNQLDLLDSISRLNHYFFQELGFGGDNDDYYNPQNSLIHKVIERRKGLPILLSLIYIEIARRLGIELYGIGFPRHFLIQPVECGSRTFYIDTFDDGNILLKGDIRDWHERWGIDLPFEECIQPSSNRTIILRVCHNLFYAHNRLQNNEGMLRSLERLMILEPKLTELHRTRSVVLGRLRRYSDSIEALENYMIFHPDATDIADCQREIEILRRLLRK